MNMDQVVKQFLSLGNFDHPDMDGVDRLSVSMDISPLVGRKAFFVARDLRDLGDYEKLEGGTGMATASINCDELLEVTFARGEKR